MTIELFRVIPELLPKTFGKAQPPPGTKMTVCMHQFEYKTYILKRYIVSSYFFVSILVSSKIKS